jgi:hypothetical protein
MSTPSLGACGGAEGAAVDENCRGSAIFIIPQAIDMPPPAGCSVRHQSASGVRKVTPGDVLYLADTAERRHGRRHVDEVRKLAEHVGFSEARGDGV